ncbi:MAG: NAD-dependent epimerase/dehydratase family protein [Candidatus Hydrothermarchaeaceae archaeon]
MNKKAEYVFGDIRDEGVLRKSIEDIEVIFHEAAAVGVGQSMYNIKKYVDANTMGTAKLLDMLVNTENDVKKMIVASSMSVYGEGKYECSKCGIIYPRLRDKKQLKSKQWEMKCPSCGKDATLFQQTRKNRWLRLQYML